MVYSDGTEARCGDKIKYDSYVAMVVANIDTGEVSPGYEDQFDQFRAVHNTGILVETQGVGLVAFFYVDNSIEIISRADKKDL